MGATKRLFSLISALAGSLLVIGLSGPANATTSITGPATARQAMVSLRAAAHGVKVPNAPGQTACHYSSFPGNVCMQETNNGYDVAFYNRGVSSLVDFNLITSSGTYGDRGAFWSVPGQYNSYFFSVGYKSWAYACLYSRDYKFAPFCTPTLYG